MFVRYLCLLPLVFLLACSSNDDGPTAMEQEMEEDEEMLQTYSFGMNVSPDYLGETETAKVFISNLAGVIVFEAELLNGEDYDFSFEAAENQEFDFTLYRLINTAGVGIYRVTTFEDFVFSNYVLDKTDVPVSIEEVSLEYFNYGSFDPSEVSVFYGPTSGSWSTANGGTIATFAEGTATGGSYYMAAINDTDPFPRYFWQESVTAPISLVDEYNILPFADDVLSVSFPSNEEARTIVLGHKDYGINSTGQVLRDVTRNSETVGEDVFLKDGLFDFYQVLCSYATGNRNYRFEELSADLNYTIDNPTFDFSLQDSSVSGFSATTSGNFNAFGASYRFTDDVSFNVSYNIVGEASAVIGFNKASLFDAIFSDILLIGSDSLEPESFGISSNSSVSSYEETIQDVLSASINSDGIGHREQSVSETFQ